MNSYSSQVTQEEPRNSMPAGAHPSGHVVSIYMVSKWLKRRDDITLLPQYLVGT